jgi:hypothetical protein
MFKALGLFVALSAFAFTAVARGGDTPPENPKSVRMAFMLYYHVGKKFKFLGGMQGKLTRYNDGSTNGEIRFGKDGLFLPIAQVLEPKCSEKKVIEVRLASNQILEILSELLRTNRGYISKKIMTDAVAILQNGSVLSEPGSEVIEFDFMHRDGTLDGFQLDLADQIELLGNKHQQGSLVLWLKLSDDRFRNKYGM